jgi:toxin ParE1/3/4
VQVRWRVAALADVAATEAYVAAFNPGAAARRLAAELVVAGDSLATFPDRGRAGLEPGTRELVPLRPYVLVHRVDGSETVQILRVDAMDRSATHMAAKSE